jgi:hypothetical protein
MKLEFEDRTWQFEFDAVTTRQGETIQAYTGLSVFAWYNKSITDAESLNWLKSMNALYWALREQNPDSEPIPIADIDVAPFKLLHAFTAAYTAENPETAVEPDPTKPGDSPDAELPSQPEAESLPG